MSDLKDEDERDAALIEEAPSSKIA